MTKSIISSNNDTFKLLKKLSEKKYREKEGLFIIEGEHLIDEAIDKNIVVEIFEIGSSSKILKYERTTLITYELAKKVLDAQSPQSVFAVCKIVKNNIVLGDKIVFLDDLQDPGNIGTIIRLCKSFDIDTLIVKNFDIYNPKCLRASQGSFFKTNIVQVDKYDELSKLMSKDFSIISTLLDKEATELKNFTFPKKSVLVLGNEGNGISQNAIDLSKHKVYIPISFESLNVATCAAIILNKWRNE
ncbi:TrmH family RNA methyltransferase [Mycoplasma crocodyli]|uniref:tRNA/rRNA methylase n=1 Tax=Mycoplasma crocodyli (strain ATCC 51981 / MP145) TaxID=512564 RepID=D5E4Q7_MYCCM|nr:RNA methyltransferase [Mycoplasma crocodyli]ADE19469.1 tRNA/rRNA methylase [Mycoplasma crocodyli MP145]